MEGTMAEVRLFAGNFAPRSWAFCNGQLLSISQNQALFSLLGTTYGGDGRTTFALPDLRGRIPVSPGTGPGLTPFRLGQRSGSETHTLTALNLPPHTHGATFTQTAGAGSVTVNVSNSTDVSNEADDSYLAQGGTVPEIYTEDPGSITMKESSVTGITIAGNITVFNSGAGWPVNNIQPSLVLNYIICMYGLFPSRN